jgi:GNAT superfamily N-acetyltransferase
MVIRRAGAGDAEAIAELILSVAAVSLLPDFAEQGRTHFRADHTPESIARRMASGFVYHVADSGGELVGVVGIRDRSHLYHLFVATAWQGNGLARTLWEHARAECLAAGHESPFTVNSAVQATGVYERFGFVRSGPTQEKNGVPFVPMELREGP